MALLPADRLDPALVAKAAERDRLFTEKMSVDIRMNEAVAKMRAQAAERERGLALQRKIAKQRRIGQIP